MSVAYSVDLVEVLVIATVLIGYSLPFCVLFVVFKIRQRKWQASHKERLDQLRSKPTDTP
jgi:hypothetical protein